MFIWNEAHSIWNFFKIFCGTTFERYAYDSEYGILKAVIKILLKITILYNSAQFHTSKLNNSNK